MLVARRNVPGEDSLPLILARGGLVEIVRDLDPVPGRKEIQVKHILGGGLKIDPVEQRLIVADVMNGPELGCVQKAATAHTIHRQKIPELGRTPSQTKVAARGAEGAIRGIHIAEDVPGPKAGARSNVRNKAGLVAKLRLRRSGDDLHALNGADGKLGGENLTLLIANCLSVDHEARLGMIAQGMKKTISVSSNAAGAVDNRLAKSSAWIEGWNL